jgi:hypothetical protein
MWLMWFLCKNKYGTFKPVEITIRKDNGREEKNRVDESIHVIIHLYMEKSQWNSLSGCAKQTKILLKNGEQENKTDPVWGLVPASGGSI